jgi:hypothetical protein
MFMNDMQIRILKEETEAPLKVMSRYPPGENDMKNNPPPSIGLDGNPAEM